MSFRREAEEEVQAGAAGWPTNSVTAAVFAATFNVYIYVHMKERV